MTFKSNSKGKGTYKIYVQKQVNGKGAWKTIKTANAKKNGTTYFETPSLKKEIHTDLNWSIRVRKNVSIIVQDGLYSLHNADLPVYKVLAAALRRLLFCPELNRQGASTCLFGRAFVFHRIILDYAERYIASMISQSRVLLIRLKMF